MSNTDTNINHPRRLPRDLIRNAHDHAAVYYENIAAPTAPVEEGDEEELEKISRADATISSLMASASARCS